MVKILFKKQNTTYWVVVLCHRFIIARQKWRYFFSVSVFWVSCMLLKSFIVGVVLLWAKFTHNMKICHRKNKKNKKKCHLFGFSHQYWNTEHFSCLLFWLSVILGPGLRNEGLSWLLFLHKKECAHYMLTIHIRT